MSHLGVECGGRGSGRTTRAMLGAPIGSVFIWCNHHLDYPKELARKLCREDLIIVGPDWLRDMRGRGANFPGVVQDHAVFDHWPIDDRWRLRELMQAVLPQVRP